MSCYTYCAGVFIERPKSLINQACTWLEYKHHNTFKFLVGISPTGYVTFWSDCYGGRASDRYIVQDSGFYDLLEREDMVMADRGFPIHEELLLRFCSLQVLPGARAKSQVTTDECKKTKGIANLATMLYHIDFIVVTCALCCFVKFKTKINSKEI